MHTGKARPLIVLLTAMAIPIGGCTTTMNHTPQEMSDFGIGLVNSKADLTNDPKPQTLAHDEAACANLARLQYPIVHIDEGAIMTTSMMAGAAGGASSGAAAAAGSGHAGAAAAIDSVGGAAQGGTNGLHQIQQIYQTQLMRQAAHYALCIEQHGHALSGTNEEDTEQAIRNIEAPGFRP